MFNDKVAQYPTIAVSEGKKKCRKEPVEWNRLGAESMGPQPPALCSIQKSSANDITNINGAEKLCRKRIDSTPRQTTNILSSQKPRKLAHNTTGVCAVAGQMRAIISAMACRPGDDGIPNHPHASRARSMPGIFAPSAPKLARTNTGKGMPYFAPACALSSMGTSTMTLPKRMVNSDCFQSMPPAMSEEASM